MKTCSKCGIEKPFDAFRPAPDMRDGFRNTCRECVRAAGRAYVHSRTPEQIEKNKQCVKRWKKSEAGRASRKAAKKRWLETPEGKAHRNRHRRKKTPEAKRRIEQRARDGLRGKYLKRLLASQGLAKAAPEVVELKRRQLNMKREIRAIGKAIEAAQAALKSNESKATYDHQNET